MKVLITGANGQVAFELQRLVDPNLFSIFAFKKDELDITQPDAISKIMTMVKPDIVINAAAYTQVDHAEENRVAAYALNQEGAKNLAIACDEICPLIHLSTDYVFDGKKQNAYLESDTVSPLNCYGESKWAGEEAIRHHCEKHIIVRLSAIFGAHGNNFLKTILRLAREKETLRVVNDQMTCPTPAKEIAEMLWQLCQKIHTQPAWGTYHFCGTPAVSWHEFAMKIIQDKNAGKLSVKNIEAISSAEYITRAQRPRYSVLNCDHLEKTFGIKQPNWEEGLTDVIKELSTE